MPGKHSAKQKRRARHVADSERKRGMSPKRAESIGWATVNARKATYAEYSMPTPPPPTPNPMIQPTTSKSSKKKTLRKDDGAVSMPAAGEGAVIGKSFEVWSLDDYHAMAKADGAPAPGAAAPAPVQGPAKKFPRKMKPTVKMKPISDGEAMANLKAGKYYEKALRYHKRALKALATGYGNVSGGGALKAPNRGYPSGSRASRSERDRPLDLMLAMDAQPTPTKVGPPKVYLPGVHSPNSPVRAKRSIGKKSINASMRPSVVSEKSPRPLDGGGATILSNALSEPSTKKSGGVVNQSAGEAAMTKTNFNNLFKSELGVAADDVLCDCPHCEAPITKSDLAKAHEGKGKTTHLTGKKDGPSGLVVKQNPEGGVMRGGDGHGVISPSRGVPGAKKHDENHVQSTEKHKKPLVKADDCSDDGSSGGESAGEKDEKKPFPPKMKKSITVRGTDYVQYIDDGSDAALAKSIMEGKLGGMGPANAQPTQPLDLNNDLTRLLY